jgi:hypothetical protein
MIEAIGVVVVIDGRLPLSPSRSIKLAPEWVDRRECQRSYWGFRAYTVVEFRKTYQLPSAELKSGVARIFSIYSVIVEVSN